MDEKLGGLWLNGYIREMLEEKRQAEEKVHGKNGKVNGVRGVTSRELSGEMGGDTQ